MIRIKNPIAPRLPVEYQEVEYIESTGTQYIDTGFKPNQNTSVEIKILIPSSQENNFVRFFETRNVDSSMDGSFGILSFRDTNRLLQYRYNGSENLSNGQLSTETEYILKADKNKLYVNDVLKITQTSTTFQVNYNLLLFGFHTPSNRTNANGIYKLYYFKLYDNGTLVRDTVPCYRKSDNESGLYDLVNNTFYPNAGTGTFLIGAVDGMARDSNINPAIYDLSLKRAFVKDKLFYNGEKSLYKQVEYIESTGTQYIDTLIKPNNKTRIICEIEGWSAGVLFGVDAGWLVNGFSLWTRLLEYGNRQYSFSGITAPASGIVELNKNNLYYNNALINSSVNSSFTSSFTLTLFALKRNGSINSDFSDFCKVRLKKCKIYDDATLIRELLPCIRKSDNVAGLLDRVNDVFYANAGTGTFLTGTVIGDI